MKNRSLFLFGVLLYSSLAFAGKEHREQFKTLQSKVAETKTAVKTACGCTIDINIDKASFEKQPTDKAREIGSNIGYELTAISEKMKEYCNDADSKSLACKKIKKFSIHSIPGSDATAEYSGTTMKISTTFQSNSGGYKMKEIMDQW